jgi:hypothetical protein
MRASGNSLTRRCRILHKIGRSEAWIRPPEPQDLAGELVGSLRGDPLGIGLTRRCSWLLHGSHKVAESCGPDAALARGPATHLKWGQLAPKSPLFGKR